MDDDGIADLGSKHAVGEARGSSVRAEVEKLKRSWSLLGPASHQEVERASEYLRLFTREC
jgi:hypothetical protein